MDLEILKEYRKKVVILMLGIIMFSASSAGIAFPMMKGFGLYSNVTVRTIVGFVICIVIEDIIAFLLIKRSIAEQILSSKTDKLVKWYLILIQGVNLNLITWCFPSKESWIFAFYFLVLMAFFLDMRVIGTCCVVDAISLMLLFLGKPVTRPVDFLIVEDSILRSICIFLSLAGVVIFVGFINKFLLNAKKEQLEKNNEHVMSVLNSVQQLSQQLQEAGSSLSKISENESASAEELAATSEQLTESSNILSTRTDESMDNLSELSEWEGVVADNVEKVENTSKELLQKSVENEKLLNNLHTINGQVSQSMTATTDMAKKLSDAVQEIGATLNLISEISTSTNLLALNASIEAARAGEAGKGFAVVATEVGNLANNTQDTLQEVETVIERIQSNVKEITKQIEENSSKLDTQNEYFENVFQSMQGMTELLHVSVDVINTMGEAQNKQSEVIKKTVSINQEIAQSIRNENAQFASINSMAESNANDTTQVATQASAINDMVEEMSKLLKRE